MKVVLSTLPKEGGAILWYTPKYFLPDNARYVPLGLLSLATNLPNGHEVVILDPHSNNWSIDKTIEEIENEKPDVLGLSTVTAKAYQMQNILEATSAEYKVVGGPHATHNAQHILNQGADAVFVGQLANLEFANAIESRPTGIVQCDTNINQIQFPNREMIDIHSYYSTGNLFESNKRMSMFSGVGCPRRCSFCDVQTKKVERINPRLVLDEMIYLQSIGAGSIHIYEDNFNTDEDYLRRLCSEIDKRNFKGEWSGRGQIKMNDEISGMLSERGFKRIHAGLESFSDKTLKFFRKGQTYDQIERFCETMHNNDIEIVGFLIYGAPTDTEHDRATAAEKIKRLGIQFPLFSILQPLPNTRYYEDLQKQGVYKKDYWNDYISNPTKNFMLPFPYGEKKWQEDADFVQELIDQFNHDKYDDDNE